MMTQSDYQLLLDELVTEFPDFRIVHKDDSLLMKVLNVVLLCLSLGQLRTFMTSFTTTIGNTVFVPRGWETQRITSRWITLRHERVHLRQVRRYGKVLFSLLYLFCLPAFWAFFRRRFEEKAYEETLWCTLVAYGEDVLRDPGFKESMVSRFTSGQYLWMWIDRASVEEWYDRTVARITAPGYRGEP